MGEPCNGAARMQINGEERNKETGPPVVILESLTPAAVPEAPERNTSPYIRSTLQGEFFCFSYEIPRRHFIPPTYTNFIPFWSILTKTPPVFLSLAGSHTTLNFSHGRTTSYKSITFKSTFIYLLYF